MGEEPAPMTRNLKEVLARLPPTVTSDSGSVPTQAHLEVIVRAATVKQQEDTYTTKKHLQQCQK